MNRLGSICVSAVITFSCLCILATDLWAGNAVSDSVMSRLRSRYFLDRGESAVDSALVRAMQCYEEAVNEISSYIHESKITDENDLLFLVGALGKFHQISNSLLNFQAFYAVYSSQDRRDGLSEQFFTCYGLNYNLAILEQKANDIENILSVINHAASVVIIHEACKCLLENAETLSNNFPDECPDKDECFRLLDSISISRDNQRNQIDTVGDTASAH